MTYGAEFAISESLPTTLHKTKASERSFFVRVLRTVSNVDLKGAHQTSFAKLKFMALQKESH